MPTTNGHGPKRAILYTRVSTDEQARSGYSLAQQIEALREYAARDGCEVLEEIADPGQSGASFNRMSVHTTVEHRYGAVYRRHYYRCPKRQRHGHEACSHRKHHRAAEMEARIWAFVSELLRDPERLRAELEEMIEQERAGSCGDPQGEITLWMGKATEVDRKRSGFQDMAAEGLITLDELRTKLAGLKETRRAAEAEIESLRGRLERVEELERNRDTLLDGYVGLIPQKLQELEPEERQQIYRMLRLRLVMDPHGGIAASGVIGAGNSLCESELTSACEYQNTKTPSFTFRTVLGGNSPRIRLEPTMTLSSQR
jgi:hypothetical protein